MVQEAGTFKWNKNELQQIDRKTKKIKTIDKEFHPRSDGVEEAYRVVKTV